MNTLLLKYLSFFTIFLSTSITYASSENSSCEHGFSQKPPSNFNTLKENLRIAIKADGPRVFEKMAYNIIHDKEFASAINKKKRDESHKSWTDIRDAIGDVLVEKYILKKIASAITEKKLNKESIIDTVIRKQTQSNNQQLYTEFVELYFNNPSFREWLYKRTVLDELQEIIDTSVTRFDRLERNLMDEAKQSSWLKFFEIENIEIPQQWRANILETIEEVYESHDFL